MGTTKSVNGPRSGSSFRTAKRTRRKSEFRLSADDLTSWREAKASLERWMLTEALERTEGNMAAAGRLLGVTKVAILHAVRRHNLGELTRQQSE